MANASGLAFQLGMAEEVYGNGVQTLTGAAGGAWTIGYDGATTTALVSLETAANIQAALNALPALGGNAASSGLGVVCTGGPLGTSPVTVTFSGSLVKNRAVAVLTSSLGANPVIVNTTPGTGYGTAVVVTRFLEVQDETIGLDIGRVETSGIRAGNRVQRTDRWAPSKRQANGDLDLEVPSKGASMLLSHLFGADPVITTPSGATNTRDHTWAGLGDDFNRSMTLQLGVPDNNGNVNAMTYTGCKFPQWEFACAVDGAMMLKPAVDAQDESLSVALATAVYPTAFEMLYWTGGYCTIGGSNVDIRSFKLTGKMSYNVDRFFLRTNTSQSGGASRKKEPIANAYIDLEAEIDLELDQLPGWYGNFPSGTTQSVVLGVQGSIIEAGGGATINPRVGLQFTMPFFRFDGTSPDVKDTDVTIYTLKGKALWDGSTQQVTARYRTTDTTK